MESGSEQHDSHELLEAREYLFKMHPNLLGDINSDEAKERARHFLTLKDAWCIYAERDQSYQKGWTDRGWKGNVCDILRKSRRIRSMFWEDTWDASSQQHRPGFGGEIDDALDLMNYAVFFIRNLRDGRKWG